jgi:hypothetical protein
MASYTYSQIKDLWVMYGGDPGKASIAAAIAMAESGGRSDAINGSNSDGSIDRGLFQINSVHGANSTTDLATNIRYAIKLSNNGNNWSPWTVYKSGAYRKYLDGPDTGGATATMTSLDIPNPLDSLKDIADKFSTIIKAGEWFSNPKNVIRIVQVVLGGALTLVGVFVLNESLVMKVAEPIAKVATAVV